jgi:hypothetical protein
VHGKCKCRKGFSKCGSHCRDLSTDVKNCGSCGHVCSDGKTCQNGRCKGGTQATCGDGVKNGTDECDGSDLDGKTCTDFGFVGAAGLTCAGNCTFDTSGCQAVCGNGTAEPGEQCDGADLNGVSCVDFGYANPAGLACAGDCTFDSSGCQAVCGNNQAEQGEVCDGSDLRGATCASISGGLFTGGTLACNGSCSGYDVAGCTMAAAGCSGKPDGYPCDDGNACTFNDFCQGEVCQAGSPVACTALDECHSAGVCDPNTGQCSNPVKPDTTPCSLGTCQGGICKP